MTENFYVESVFEHEGLKCVVVLQKMAHRCGYVGVPESHPFYERKYDDVDIMVHGGLTFSDNYSDYPIETEEKTWWFGFDCAHCDDAKDYDAVIEKMPEYTHDIEILRKLDAKYPIPGQMVWTQKMVEAECRDLAEQLAEVEE